VKSPRLTIAILCLFTVASCHVLWGADLNIKGNVNVQGDGSGTAPGNLKVKNALTVQGNLLVTKDFLPTKTFDTFSTNSSPMTLGFWDFCFLSSVEIGKGDGSCSVNMLTQTGNKGRKKWQLSAGNAASCTATCLSFVPKENNN
jgi:hypothetical protein